LREKSFNYYKIDFFFFLSSSGILNNKQPKLTTMTTQQQPTSAQIKWMNEFCMQMWEACLSGGFGDEPAEQRRIHLLEGGFALFVMDMLYDDDTDFEDDDETKNWDKEFISECLSNLLNSMMANPEMTMAVYGVEAEVRSQ
jgi:hypothetical protein